MWKSWTGITVAIFVIILLLASNSARGDDGFRLSLGHTVFNSTLPMAEIGYEYNNWELSANLISDGDTKRGEQDHVNLYTVSYLTRPDWCWNNICNYYRLGIAKNDGSPLIGPEVFRLGVGVQYKNIVSFELSHWSSAGIHSPNRGVDAILLRYHIPNPW